MQSLKSGYALLCFLFFLESSEIRIKWSQIMFSHCNHIIKNFMKFPTNGLPGMLEPILPSSIWLTSTTCE
jgi:hypothetical protein